MSQTNQVKISESKLIILLGLVQFIDILDFMIVMPLGPDYAKVLNVNQSQLGLTAVAYTIAAAISGFLSSIYIDRFERKRALIFALLGLMISAIIASLASSFIDLLTARFIAGLFGGPSTAVCFAIISDLVIPEKRGYVIGKVMSGFSFAATIGVPICLEISRLSSWKYAFLGVCAAELCVITLVILLLPQIRIHLDSQTHIKKVTYHSIFTKKINIIGFVFYALGSMASFMIIPYISAYLQLNLDFDRKFLGLLYFTGGVCSFITVQIIGKLVDKYSSSTITWISNIFIAFTLIFGFSYYLPSIPIAAVYVPFMIGMSIRMVAGSTLVSKIPAIHERAGYMSLISTFHHMASALGSYLTSLILYQASPLARLENMPIVALSSLTILLLIPFIMKFCERQLSFQKEKILLNN